MYILRYKLDSLKTEMRFKAEQQQLRGPVGHKNHGIPNNVWKNYVGDGVDGC